jgi:hypothetical protein
MIAKDITLVGLLPGCIWIHLGNDKRTVLLIPFFAITMNNQLCPVCKSLIIGRTDKKYCCDQCRALANNEKKMKAQQILLTTNSLLRKNRTILKTLCPQGKSTVRKEVLMAMEFRPDLFTSIFVTSKKQVYYLVYDFAFSPIMEGEIEKALIVSRQEYMQRWDPWKVVHKR